MAQQRHSFQAIQAIHNNSFDNIWIIQWKMFTNCLKGVKVPIVKLFEYLLMM